MTVRIRLVLFVYDYNERKSFWKWYVTVIFYDTDNDRKNVRYLMELRKKLAIQQPNLSFL